MNEITVGLLGCGEMGSAIICGVAKTIGKKNVFLYNRTHEKAEKLSKKLAANFVTRENELIEKKCKYIFLAVKPYAIKDTIQKLFERTTKSDITLVSVAASVSLEDLYSFLPENQKKSTTIIRLMPNIPCSVGEGMIALSAYDTVDEEKIAEVTTILKKAGRVERVLESMLDGVTALSGSGVAYGFMFIEALADAGVQFGMTRKQAYIYAAQMLKGAGAMVLQTEEHPGVLKDAVCSPGGITIKALETLEKEGFRGAIISGAKTAFEASKNSGK